MSLSIKVDVHCDVCGDWCDGAIDSEKALRQEARSKARDSGFKVTAYDRRLWDLCGNCTVLHLIRRRRVEVTK